MKIERMLLAKNGKLFYIKDQEKDFHCQYGYIKGQVMTAAKDGDILSTNTGKKLVIFTPSFCDKYRKIKRGAQIIPLKDVGAIITQAGIGRNSKVLEAGSGSGALTCYLAHVCKKVYTYEIREDFFNIVKKNIETFGFKNVVQKQKDIYEGIPLKNLDMILLDLPEPWRVIPHAKKALKVGGFIVSYSPSIPQTMDFVSNLGDLVHVRTIEIIEREWEITDRKVRPKSQPIGHSGFISVGRRVK